MRLTAYQTLLIASCSVFAVGEHQGRVGQSDLPTNYWLRRCTPLDLVQGCNFTKEHTAAQLTDTTEDDISGVACYFKDFPDQCSIARLNKPFMLLCHQCAMLQWERSNAPETYAAIGQNCETFTDYCYADPDYNPTTSTSNTFTVPQRALLVTLAFLLTSGFLLVVFRVFV